MIKLPSEMEHYLDALLSDPALRNVDLSKIYAVLDSKLQLHDKSSVRMAAKLQETRSKNDVCPIFAHICALNALGGKGRRNSIINEFKSYAKQGFPSIEDSNTSRNWSRPSCQASWARTSSALPSVCWLPRRHTCGRCRGKSSGLLRKGTAMRGTY